MLSYIDTDSFVLNLKTEDLVSHFWKLQREYRIFDSSNLDEENNFFSNELNKLPRYLKIETPKSLSIKEFVCLRSKVYAYKTDTDYDN